VSVNEEIRALQRYLVFTPTDRNPQTISVTCRHHYENALLRHLNSPAYEDAVDSSHTLSAASKLCHDLGLQQAQPDVIPYVYIIPKLHYTPVRWRPICGTASTPTRDSDGAKDKQKTNTKPTNYNTELGKTLAAVVRGCLDILKHHQDGSMRHAGQARYRTQWTCTSVDDVTFTLMQRRAKNHRRCHSFLQQDMGAMYTSLSQDTVIKNTLHVIDDAIDVAARTLGVTRDQIRIHPKFHDFFGTRRIHS
jgi:hypothetical protein